MEKLVGWRSQQKESEKYSCWSLSEFLTAAGRPGRSTANGHIFDRWGITVDRPGRPKQTESTVSAPVDPDGRPAPVSSEKSDLQKPEPGIKGLIFWVGVLDLVKNRSMIISHYSNMLNHFDKNLFDKNLFFQRSVFPKLKVSKTNFQNMLSLKLSWK